MATAPLDHKLTAVCLCAVATLACVTLMPSSLRAQDLVFTDVNVVDVRNGSVLENRAVRVRGETVISVTAGPDAEQVDESDVVVDANGAFLAPGLMDMHFHLQAPEHATLNLLRGVTTVRNMWGSPDTLA
ncbi:MAG: hypothetical protein Cons2KO_28600 [Congregibacter sp.]